MATRAMLPIQDYFPASERDRVSHTAMRYCVATEQAEIALATWFPAFVDPDRLATWGPPDVSQNVLVSISRSISTPGLYGRVPQVQHEEDSAAALIGPGGELAASGFWSLKQEVQFLAAALGACVHGLDYGVGGSRFAIVSPHECFVRTHPDDPTRVVIFYRLRFRSVGDERLACWDIWDVSDPDLPSFSIREARRGGEIGEDFTAAVTGSPALVGDSYPARYGDGLPFIPYEVQRFRETGDVWSWRHGRGLFHGTMTAMLLSTYALKAARDATGGLVIVAGIKLRGKDAKGGETSFQFNPGDILEGEIEPGSTPFVKEVTSGAFLEPLGRYIAGFKASLAAEVGIAPSDVMRTSQNPMSGVALHIGNAGKRELQERQIPIGRRVDSSTIRKIAALYNAANPGAEVPEVGYTIAYREIERSPAEIKEERDGHDWELSRGLASPVDILLSRSPDLTEEGAIDRLARVALHRQRIEARVAAMGAAVAPPPAALDMLDDTSGE